MRGIRSRERSKGPTDARGLIIPSPNRRIESYRYISRKMPLAKSKKSNLFARPKLIRVRKKLYDGYMPVAYLNHNNNICIQNLLTYIIL